MTLEIKYYDEAYDEVITVIEQNFTDILEAVRYYESKKYSVVEVKSKNTKK